LEIEQQHQRKCVYLHYKIKVFDIFVTKVDKCIKESLAQVIL